MRIETVTCDGCGSDLTTRTNSVDYRLVLAPESKPGHGDGFYTAMMIYPPLERTHHFCRLDCLDLWRDRQRYLGSLWNEWWEKWREEKGVAIMGLDEERCGTAFEEEPSEELRTSLRKEYEAAALAKFPMKVTPEQTKAMPLRCRDSTPTPPGRA